MCLQMLNSFSLKTRRSCALVSPRSLKPRNRPWWFFLILQKILPILSCLVPRTNFRLIRHRNSQMRESLFPVAVLSCFSVALSVALRAGGEGEFCCGVEVGFGVWSCSFFFVVFFHRLRFLCSQRNYCWSLDFLCHIRIVERCFFLFSRFFNSWQSSRFLRFFGCVEILRLQQSWLSKGNWDWNREGRFYWFILDNIGFSCFFNNFYFGKLRIVKFRRRVANLSFWRNVRPTLNWRANVWLVKGVKHL